MKRSNAIRHLVEMAEVATDRQRLRTTEIGWPLDEMWVAGALLERTYASQAHVGNPWARARIFHRLTMLRGL